MASQSSSFPKMLTSTKESVFKQVMSGDWPAVLDAYDADKDGIQTVSITSSKETVLHIAISDNRGDVALKLIEKLKDSNKFECMKNDKGNTPLHLAASLGQEGMCEKLLSRRQELVMCRNDEGETPLFVAALHGKKRTFCILHRHFMDLQTKIRQEDLLADDIVHCKRNDGNSILHVAVLGEYYDLAFLISKWYPDLMKFKNENGHSALHLLANHPSAFRSGCHLGPLNNLVYRCLLVEEMKFMPKGRAEDHFPAHERQPTEAAIKIPENCTTCFDLLKILRSCVEVFLPKTCKDGSRNKQDEETGPPSKRQEVRERILPCPSNYYTLFRFMAFLMEFLVVVFGLGLYKASKLKDKKRKHTFSMQLMKELVICANSWENEDTGSKPSSDYVATDSNLYLDELPQTLDESETTAYDTGSPEEEIKEESHTKSRKFKDEGQRLHKHESKKANKVNKQEEAEIENQDTKEKSPLLVAAKMGVTEMVKEILESFPVAIDDMNKEKKNAVLLAVENRQPKVYLYLQKKYHTKESIFQKVDFEGNSALHLAATFSKSQPWLIPGAALQMQWELKWYKFIKDSMPRHFFAHLNNKRKTPKEVLTETHKELVKYAGKWLTSTAESCSVVAALIATVAFASATTLPGGVKEDTGIPVFEGDIAFDVFVVSSLVALCFSITSLTMFLSILTSRYQVSDFHHNLPSKLVLGLTSLFISIVFILVSFCSGHFLSVRSKLRFAVFPIYAITCLPITLFGAAQFPLYVDLIRSIIAPVPKRSFEGTSI